MKSAVPMNAPVCVKRPPDAARRAAGRLGDPGEAQVKNADDSRSIEHQVAGLDVAVNDP